MRKLLTLMGFICVLALLAAVGAQTEPDRGEYQGHVFPPVPAHLVDGTFDIPMFAKAKEFILSRDARGRPRFPKGHQDYREIILTAWHESRVIWEHPSVSRTFTRPEEPMYCLLAQQAAESEFDRHARSRPNKDGSRDLGISQQNSRYLRARGITDWRDIGQNVKAQALFMCELLQESSRFAPDRARRAAWAGYTAGPRWARRGEVPDIGRTRGHVTKIAAYYRELCGPEKSPTPMPAPAGRVYVVKPGDVLWKIARRYGTTVQGLAARNNLADPNLILPGQELIIP